MPLTAELLGVRILVIDDHEADLRLTGTILAGCGYSNVTCVSDAETACEMYLRKPFDAVILDLVMPGMDGFAVMERLRGESAESFLPIIAVTADPALVERALECGARDFIGKPLRIAEVRSRVRNVLHVGRLWSSLQEHQEQLERTLVARTESLRESEAVFRLFANDLPQGIWIRGAQDRTFRYLNPAMRQVTGRRLALGDPIDRALDALHPDDRPSMEGAIERHPHGGIDMEARFIHGDGTARTARVRTFAINVAAEGPPWIAGTMEDITSRKAAEQALREAESRFRAMVEQSIAGIYELEHGCITYANPRLCEMLGYTLDELRAMPSLSMVVEEDQPRLAANRLRAIEGHADALLATYRVRRKDGQIVVLGVDGNLIEREGRRVLLGIAQDVTEAARTQELLVQAESHYRALVEQSLVGIFIVRDERIFYANPMLCELSGYRIDELVRIPVRDFFVAQDLPVAEAILQRRRRGETDSIAWRCRMRRKDGGVLNLSIESKVIDLVGGKAVLGVVQDVTERERAQSDLEEANRRLRVLSRSVLDIQEQERLHISRELHDDVGQSLLALRMGLHRMKDHLYDRGGAIHVECIRVSDAIQEKLREMSMQLHPPQLEQLGLHDALRWLVNRQRTLTGLSIACRLGLPSRFPVEIENASYRICQEALNNATRHSRALNIAVELESDGESVILTVRDDGVGFDEEAKREEALLRGSMGLISMEERARLAGGRLEIRTGPGKGTAVSTYFPLVTPAAGPAEIVSASQDTA